MRLAAIACVAALVAGCGTKSEPLPAACIQGPGIFMSALAKAPGLVTLKGTPISHCFNKGASGTDIQIVGTNLLGAEQELLAKRRLLAVGYLIGAAQRGARRSGLGAEIVRRIEAEPSGREMSSPEYRRGLRAGLAQG